MVEKIKKTDEQWRALLSEEQFQVTRRHGTERPFSGEYCESKQPGTYLCVCCGQPLFRSEEKYDSGSGWPSYWQPVNEKAVETTRDTSHGMERTEVR
ncbi:MAG: peptide-methionine (R)-S-oxide reductase MsrB, partial [Thiohalophilus sp.]